MRKNIFGRQFSRTANQRKSLFKSLLSSLILKESIKTTLEKAKAIKGEADKIINKAKRGDVELARQLLQRSLGSAEMNKVIKDLAPRFKDRNSGYARIMHLGRRFSDNAEMAVMEWVVKPEIKDRTSKIKNETKELTAGKSAATEAQKKVETQSKIKRKAAKKQ